MQTSGATPARRRFTADEFQNLAVAGILDEHDRVELIDGDIVEMAPISTDHAGGVNFLNTIFTTKLGDRIVAAVQNPVRLDDFNEPQPDFCLLRPRDDHYRRAHPRPDDVLLLVEVAHTTQRYDRGTKAPLYARHGVSEVWVVDLVRLSIEIFRDPSPAGYRQQHRLEPGDAVSPVAFPELEIEVSEVVGAD